MAHRRGAAAAPRERASPRRTAIAPRVRARLLEALARHATVGIYLNDATGSTYYLNREACRIIGLPRARALGRGWSETLHPEDRARVLRDRERAVARGALYRTRLRFLHRDGRVVWAEAIVVPVRDRGRVQVRVGMLREIAERAPPAATDMPAGRRWDELSPQERRVLRLLVEGKTNKEIAADLGLSDKTVKNYLSCAFQKLHVTRRSQAAALYARRSADR